MRFWLLCVVLMFVAAVRCDDEEEKEEKDPWDKSTDKYWRDSPGGGHASPQGDVDVTETTESEVHTQKSKVAAHPDKVKAEQAVKALKPKKNGSSKKHSKKQHLAKKTSFNPEIGDFYPGNLWQYPYPYFHPQYVAVMAPCACSQNQEMEDTPDIEGKNEGGAIEGKSEGVPVVEAKNENSSFKIIKVPKTEKAKKGKKAKARGWIPVDVITVPTDGFGGDNTNGNGNQGSTGGVWGGGGLSWEGYTFRKKSKTKQHKKQLVPSHYYGPPSAGWGGFQPGKTGGGWGVPYWYKKRQNTHQRQLVPSHYYGPPSAGWGGFQPGKTGSGWGVPYWYKKRQNTHQRQLVPSHYYGPPSAGWGGFQPGKTGSGWGVPYWYKSSVAKPEHKHKKSNKKSKHAKKHVVRASRKFVVTAGQIGNQLNGGWDHGVGRGHGIRQPMSLGPMNPMNAFYQQMTPAGGVMTVPQPSFRGAEQVDVPQSAFIDRIDENTAANALAPFAQQVNSLSPVTGDVFDKEQSMNAFGTLNAMNRLSAGRAPIGVIPLNPIMIANGLNPQLGGFLPKSTKSIDYLAWNGANSLGSKGWLGNGWVGGLEGVDRPDVKQPVNAITHSPHGQLQKILPGHGIGLPNVGFEGGFTTSMLGGNPYSMSSPDTATDPASNKLKQSFLLNAFLRLNSDQFKSSKVPKKVKKVTKVATTEAKAAGEEEQAKPARRSVSSGTMQIIDELAQRTE